jgi:predicted anti-sigma-YlaC factor YlaD
MLSCREITQVVTEYLEGGLSLGDRLRFQLHVGMCRHCRKYFRQMKLTAKALGYLPEPKLPPNIEQELLHRFETWKASRAGA